MWRTQRMRENKTRNSPLSSAFCTRRSAAKPPENKSSAVVREKLGHTCFAGLVDIADLLIGLNLVLRLAELFFALGPQNLVHRADLFGSGTAFERALDAAAGCFDLVDFGLSGREKFLARADHVFGGAAVMANACHISTPNVRKASVKSWTSTAFSPAASAIGWCAPAQQHWRSSSSSSGLL